jgi:hypothetical protein
LGIERSERFSFGIDRSVVDQHIQSIHFVPDSLNALIKTCRIRDLQWQDVDLSTITGGLIFQFSIMLRRTAARKDPVAARCTQTNKFESKTSIRTGDKDSVHGHGSCGTGITIRRASTP